MFLVVAVMLAWPPLCRIWFLKFQITWRPYIVTAWDFLLCFVVVHTSHVLEVVSLLWWYLHVFTGALSDFKAHLPANHIALATGHLKNKWIHVSSSFSHKGQGLSLYPNLNIKFLWLVVSLTQFSKVVSLLSQVLLSSKSSAKEQKVKQSWNCPLVLLYMQILLRIHL